MGVTIIKKLPKYGKNLKKKIKSVMPYISQYLRSCAVPGADGLLSAVALA